MEIEGLVKKMKDIYTALIDFIEATDDSDAEYITLIEVLEKQEILENKDEVRLLFQLISKIADNHHRMPDFFDKLEKIFHYLIKDIPSKISYFIPNYRKYNKRILFLLLEKRFVKPDETFLIQYLQSKEVKKISLLFDQKETNLFQIYYYLYPKMREFLEEKVEKQVEEEILQKYSETISKFEEKCQKGENDSYICSLIRSDSVE